MYIDNICPQRLIMHMNITLIKCIYAYINKIRMTLGYTNLHVYIPMHTYPK